MDKPQINIGIVAKNKTSKSTVEAQLAQIDPEADLELVIHSEGGDVFEGFAIGQLIAQWKGKTTARVECMAFSIASYIAACCDEVVMAPNGYLMLHKPKAGTDGDDEQHKARAQLLTELTRDMVQAYAQKSGLSTGMVETMLRTGMDRFISAREAVELGLADSIRDGEPVAVALFDQAETLPQRVYASLFGASAAGVTEPQVEKIMQTTQPEPASVVAIEKAFPKASAEFVLACVKKELTINAVAEAAAVQAMEENEELMARISAMEEELEEYKAKVAAMEEEELEAMEEEKPVARSRGNRPVASATGGTQLSATARWNDAVKAHVSGGVAHAKAVAMADKENPGLRSEMLLEVNAR